MSTAVMTQRMTSASPRLLGRLVLAGYLVLTIAGYDLFYVFGKVIVRTDAAATARNIQAQEVTFYTGFALALLGVAAYLVVTAVLYRLYEPVNRTLSLTAAFFSLTGTIVQAAGLIFRLNPLPLLGGQAYVNAFTPEQRQALALVLFNSYSAAYTISLVFFAFYLVCIGYLTFRSTFLPRWLGALVMLGALGLAFMVPPLARALYPYVMLGSFGELLLVLWLGIKGVNVQRWHEMARAAAADALEAR